MGSDMSRPKNKCKNNYPNNSYNDVRCKPRPYSKSMVFRDPEFDLPPNIILHERGSSPMQVRSANNHRKSFENNAYTERSSRDARSLNESPINLPPSSNVSTPHLTQRIPIYYASDSLEKQSKHRVHSSVAAVDRYKTTRIITRARNDDDRYYDKREPAHYSTSRYHNQPQPLPPSSSMYETFDGRKHDIEILPAERIYDNRKQETKYILKPLERSQSPLPSRSIRSRSSDRVLDGPKTVRYEDEFYFKSSGDDSDAMASQKNKHSASYIVNNSQSIKENSNEHRYRDNSVYIEKRVPYAKAASSNTEYENHNHHHLHSQQSQIESKSSSAIVNVCSGSEIVYVPMVKEEFIKRETQKTAQINPESTQKITPTIQTHQISQPASSSSSSMDNIISKNNSSSLSSQNNKEILKVQRQSNKIIITELVPPRNGSTNNRNHNFNEEIETPKKNLASSSSNETLSQKAYHFDPHMINQHYRNHHHHHSSQSAYQSVPATFQPAKTSSFRRSELDGQCLISNDKMNSNSNSSTHYIIQPDPNFDTKIIDGLLKQKKLSDFDENKC